MHAHGRDLSAALPGLTDQLIWTRKTTSTQLTSHSDACRTSFPAPLIHAGKAAGERSANVFLLVDGLHGLLTWPIDGLHGPIDVDQVWTGRVGPARAARRPLLLCSADTPENGGSSRYYLDIIQNQPDISDLFQITIQIRIGQIYPDIIQMISI